jgi:ketosteroid isomerase-like protein
VHALERMRLFRSLAFVAAAFLLLVQAARAQGISPSVVVSRFERYWGQHDLDAALAQFSDDAVVTIQDTRPRTSAGPEQIRQFLESARLRSPPMLTTPRQVDGASVTWSEHTERPGQIVSGTELTVRASVRDGKIESLTFRPGTLVPGPVALQATDDTSDSAALALGALVLLGVGLLSLATVRSHVRAGSILRGRLLQDLRAWRRTPV